MKNKILFVIFFLLKINSNVIISYNLNKSQENNLDIDYNDINKEKIYIKSETIEFILSCIGIFILIVTIIILYNFDIIASFFQQKEKNTTINFNFTKLLEIKTISIERAKELEKTYDTNSIEQNQLIIYKSLIDFYNLYDIDYLKENLDKSKLKNQQIQQLLSHLLSNYISDDIKINDNIDVLLPYINSHGLERHKQKQSYIISFFGFLLLTKKKNFFLGPVKQKIITSSINKLIKTYLEKKSNNSINYKEIFKISNLQQYDFYHNEEKEPIVDQLMNVNDNTYKDIIDKITLSFTNAPLTIQQNNTPNKINMLTKMKNFIYRIYDWHNYIKEDYIDEFIEKIYNYTTDVIYEYVNKKIKQKSPDDYIEITKDEIRELINKISISDIGLNIIKSSLTTIGQVGPNILFGTFKEVFEIIKTPNRIIEKLKTASEKISIKQIENKITETQRNINNIYNNYGIPIFKANNLEESIRNTIAVLCNSFIKSTVFINFFQNDPIIQDELMSLNYDTILEYIPKDLDFSQYISQVPLLNYFRPTTKTKNKLLPKKTNTQIYFTTKMREYLES